MPPEHLMANRIHRTLLCSFRAAAFLWNPYPGRRFAAVPLRSAPGWYVGARWAEEAKRRPVNRTDTT